MGRCLIFPKLVEIARYDTVATAASGGMQPRLRDIKVENANNGSPRLSGRREENVRVLAQLETGRSLDQQQGALGNVPMSARVCIFDTEDLAALGLLDEATRLPLLKPTDRIHAIYDNRTEDLIELVQNPPGLFAHQVGFIDFGFYGGPASLVYAAFMDRAQGNR
jgi:hypothetical protein